ncbi:hypothetical protein HNP84_008418 [Thermocatellispora tengchongensis]|uniref:Stress-response A/B barrel domain-containing protein n=1 Tax=Thermocatellispora tengchongensis TaxID=1073253 RepID=A0A840PB87_9ACTN|nr:Dabb family protein [Thermocatellispora tengchongensis]MBB5138664.1 hypothetical protein [Thermocatellispora tengchongensis]
MFRHVVLFRWTEDATDEDKERVARELRALPETISEIRAYHVGHDAGVNQGNYEFAVVADFDDTAGYLVYRDHPAHRAVIDKYINPYVAARAAVQYEL